ncbi:MAG: CvpA family protein [bacterium]|jgi:uncharacterized membrane protein required for colicin V production|nr:CvpA family protein [bacterium]
MGFIDIVLLVIIAAFTFFGLFFGLIHTIGSLVGTIFGVIAATIMTDTVFGWLGGFVGDSSLARIVTFIIIFIIAHRLVGMVLWVFQKIFGIFSVIPFATTINRLLGGGLGFVEGVIVVGVLIFYAMQVIPDTALVATLETSLIAKFLLGVIGAIQSVFPGLA